MKPIFLDFETKAIEDRPVYPPEPVGLAVYDPENQFESKYYAFGHNYNNDCTFEDVKKLLTDIWSSGRETCYHNSAFDVAIIHEKFGLPYPEKYHDTLFLAFLKNPYAKSLSLKSFTEEHLGIAPDERDEIFEWIVANIPEAKRKPSSAGAYIWLAPTELVARYAMQDVYLTEKLFDYCQDVITDQLEPYERELKLMPILLENSKLGVRVDREGLIAASKQALDDIEKLEKWLDKYFGLEERINYNSGAQLVKLIFEKGANDPDIPWPVSDKGTPLSDKDTLKANITDPFLSSVLRHRDALVKINGTYLEPFIKTSETTGKIYTGWNQVRGDSGVGGTRTGRLSGKPTLQTLISRFPKTPLPLEVGEINFPIVRSFLLPDENEIMVAADFQAQELRLFAHFEAGQLAEQYRKDPNVDLHTFSRDLMAAKSGRDIPRDYAKTLSFGILYGAGPKKISEMLNIPYNEAKELIALYKGEVATGLQKVNDILEERYRMRKPFKTIGGRLLKGEPPALIRGKVMEFGYKSLNALIQGSGADMAKEAMVLYATKTKHGRLLMSIHDELVITCLPEHKDEEAALLVECMTTAFTLSVPFVAEAKFGNNFSEVK